MDRRAVSRNVRRLSPFIVLVAVLGLLAGGLPALVAQPSAGHRPWHVGELEPARDRVWSFWWD